MAEGGHHLRKAPNPHPHVADLVSCISVEEELTVEDSPDWEGLEEFVVATEQVEFQLGLLQELPFPFRESMPPCGGGPSVETVDDILPVSIQPPMPTQDSEASEGQNTEGTSSTTPEETKTVDILSPAPTAASIHQPSEVSKASNSEAMRSTTPEEIKTANIPSPAPNTASTRQQSQASYVQNAVGTRGTASEEPNARSTPHAPALEGNRTHSDNHQAQGKDSHQFSHTGLYPSSSQKKFQPEDQSCWGQDPQDFPDWAVWSGRSQQGAHPGEIGSHRSIYHHHPALLCSAGSDEDNRGWAQGYSTQQSTPCWSERIGRPHCRAK